MALAPSPNRTAGVASITIDGVTWAVASGLSWAVNDYNVEALVGQSGLQGTKEMVKPGVIKATLRDTAGCDVTSLATARTSSVVVEAANGKIITGSNMFRVGDPPVVNTEDGTFEVEFNGGTVSEN